MTNLNRLYVDIHAIQTLPPSNVNRDDIGAPKTAQYGGVTRARVSSQSWKKAMRDYFVDHLDENKMGTRTLELAAYIAKKIQNIDNGISYKDAKDKAKKAIATAGIAKNDKMEKIDALFFIGHKQAERLAQAIVDGVNDEDKLVAIMNDNPAIDISLFGRMLANKQRNMDVDASVEVSHAISTHAVDNEYDFYTGIDDFTKNAGAGMLGTTEFNSSTLYRYANVDVHELLNHLVDVQTTVNTIKLFVEAFTKSMPTGMVTSFANQTLPQALVVTVRSDRPVNMINGFEKPVSSDEGYVKKSIERLKDAFAKNQRFSDKPLFTLTIGVDGLGEDEVNLNALLDDLDNKLESLLSKD